MAGESSFSFSQNYDFFVLGDRAKAKEIVDSILSLGFLNLVNNKDLFAPRENMFFVIVICDYSSLRNVKVVARSVPRITNPNAYKIMYVLNPTQIRIDHLFFGHEIDVKYQAFGTGKEKDLRAYLKSIFLARKEKFAVEPFEKDIQQAARAGDQNQLKRITARLLNLGKNNPDALRLLTLTCTTSHQYKKAQFYLKSLLELNPQDMWAASELAKIHTKMNSPKEGIKELEELTAYIYVPDSAEDQLMPMQYLATKDLSEEMLTFMMIRASMAASAQQTEESVYFYRAALAGAGKKPEMQTDIAVSLAEQLLKLDLADQALQLLETYTKGIKIPSTRAQQATRQAKLVLAKKPDPASSKGSSQKGSAKPGDKKELVFDADELEIE